MKRLPTALQLYSVREQMEADFAATLKAVKAMGYDGVEFAGLYGHKPQEVKQLCEDVGLVPISAHIPYVDMMAAPQKMLEEYAVIGCQYVVIPYLTEEYRPGNPKFAEVIEGAKLLGQTANQLGMTLLYHNHDFEFVQVNGDFALDVLYREVGADLLQTQLDTCWIKVAGQDPAAYIRKYAGRAPIVHLKDFVGQRSDNMYALIGIDDGDQKTQPSAFAFRPLGMGVQDIPAILKAADEAGSQWLVIEQDEPSLGKSAMECAEISIQYLQSIQ